TQAEDAAGHEVPDGLLGVGDAMGKVTDGEILHVFGAVNAFRCCISQWTLRIYRDGLQQPREREHLGLHLNELGTEPVQTTPDVAAILPDRAQGPGRGAATHAPGAHSSWLLGS